MKLEIKEKILEIRNKLMKWNKEYYIEDSPSVSDAQYDGLMNELISLEKQYPEFYDENSPSVRVGGKALDHFVKIKHDFPMMSLGNAFSYDDVLSFKSQINRELARKDDFKIVGELKIDGLSIAIKYKNGQLDKAITRGDGIVGEDVTLNVRTIKSIPLKISYKEDLEVRGEIFMSNSTFDSLNKSGHNFANPRNAAAGTIRQLDSKIASERDLEAFIYSIPNPLDHNLKTHTELLSFLKANGFRVNPESKLLNSDIEIKDYIEHITNVRESLDYTIDGIVFKVNDINLYEDIGFTSKFPKFMIAFKFPEEQARTKLIDIFPTVGRTGRITYNAKLEPVRLGGSTISSATLHNANYIYDLDLNIGDEVYIKKAGEIIPKVVSVFKKNNNEKWVETKECPNCSSTLIRELGEVDQYCLNQDCSAIIEASIIHFASRNAMNIEGLGENLVKRLLNQKVLTTLPSIYDLELHKQSLINMEGFNIKSVDNLINSIEKSKSSTLERFIFALGIRYIGEKTAKVLAKRFGSIDALINSSLNDLLKIRDLGEVGANSIIKHFSQNKHVVVELVSKGIIFNTSNLEVKNIFNGKNFVITGTLSKPRSYFKDKIELGNGNVSSAVSKNTDYLLIGENPGSKYDKAKSLNITIINENEFLKLMEEYNG